MATVKDSIPHVLRTATDQRQRETYTATIGRIEQINSTIRIIRLYLDPSQPPLRHLPGQYVDLSLPNTPRVGGFTITSPPQTALSLPAPTPSTTTPPSAATFDDPYVELAIQKSPTNPPAAYIWQQQPSIMNAPVSFRVGGNFTYPPMNMGMQEFKGVDNVVFVAGGVGVNPIMSMLGAMEGVGNGNGKIGGLTKKMRVLYSSKRGVGQDGEAEEVLFEKRLETLAKRVAQKHKSIDFEYLFFETSGAKSHGNTPEIETEGSMPDNMKIHRRRMQKQDLFEALGAEGKREHTLVYVCGVPHMTDEFVEIFKGAPGMNENRVFCEKWW